MGLEAERALVFLASASKTKSMPWSHINTSNNNIQADNHSSALDLELFIKLCVAWVQIAECIKYLNFISLLF